jgi:hypothetical protein
MPPALMKTLRKWFGGGDDAVLCPQTEFCHTSAMLATAFTELVGCQVPIQ